MIKRISLVTIYVLLLHLVAIVVVVFSSLILFFRMLCLFNNLGVRERKKNCFSDSLCDQFMYRKKKHEEITTKKHETLLNILLFCPFSSISSTSSSIVIIILKSSRFSSQSSFNSSFSLLPSSFAYNHNVFSSFRKITFAIALRRKEEETQKISEFSILD